MKKTYETPVVEKVEFNYEDQVVASNSDYSTSEFDGYYCFLPIPK